MDKKNLRSGDIVTSIALILLSLFVAWHSIALLRANPDRRFYMSAGLMPLVFSILLIVISVSVIFIAVREGGTLELFAPSRIFEALRSSKGLKTIFVLAWLLFYIVGLLELFPYLLATFIFLFVLICVFYGRLVPAILISAVTAAVITFAFGSIAGIPLP